jgi:peroxiredoxin 2/4
MNDMPSTKPSVRLDEPLPHFRATTTIGEINIDTYKGKWVVLFSCTGAFTAICSTEIAAFAERLPDFTKRDVEIIGLSIDSVYALISWTRNIEEIFGKAIKFPIIADLDTKVSQAYGMIHPKATNGNANQAIRSVFIIDPFQVVRAIMLYPPSLGRNIDEIIRVIDSLQLFTETGMSTPANWRLGGEVFPPTPRTAGGAELASQRDPKDMPQQRRAQGDDAPKALAWYLPTS